MFYKKYNGWPQEKSDTLPLKCPHCGNICEHYVYIAPHGIQLGIIFMRKPLISAKQYFIACSTCHYLSKEITKQQAESMRRRA